MSDDSEDRDELERHANERPSLVREFVEFLVRESKWWLVPIVVVLLLLTAIAWFAATPAGPFIYPGL